MLGNIHGDEIYCFSGTSIFRSNICVEFRCFESAVISGTREVQKITPKRKIPLCNLSVPRYGFVAVEKIVQN